MTDGINDAYESPEDIGRSPEAIARRWKLEIKLAQKRERGWRDKVKEIYKS